MYKTVYKNPLYHKILDRPFYGYNIYQAAILAKKLSIPKISIIEFGVANGGGLLNIEKHTKRISSFLDINFEIYGFDTACGLPELLDYRDIKHNWKNGLFEMDLDSLKKKLKMSTLVIGRIEETLKSFFDTYKPAPIGCILFDLDLYSSTSSALTIFENSPNKFLPRVRCYFDDILGNDTSLTNEFLGEALAIKEFNKKELEVKVTPVTHLLAKFFRYKYYSKCYAAHLFNHPLYNHFLN